MSKHEFATFLPNVTGFAVSRLRNRIYLAEIHLCTNNIAIGCHRIPCLALLPSRSRVMKEAQCAISTWLSA